MNRCATGSIDEFYHGDGFPISQGRYRRRALLWRRVPNEPRPPGDGLYIVATGSNVAMGFPMNQGRQETGFWHSVDKRDGSNIGLSHWLQINQYSKRRVCMCERVLTNMHIYLVNYYIATGLSSNQGR